MSRQPLRLHQNLERLGITVTPRYPPCPDQIDPSVSLPPYPGQTESKLALQMLLDEILVPRAEVHRALGKFCTLVRVGLGAGACAMVPEIGLEVVVVGYDACACGRGRCFGGFELEVFVRQEH